MKKHSVPIWAMLLLLLICPLLVLSTTTLSTTTGPPSVASCVASSHSKSNRDASASDLCQLHDVLEDSGRCCGPGPAVLDYSDPGKAADAQRRLELCANSPLTSTDFQHIEIKGYGSLLNQTSLGLCLETVPDLQELHWTNTDIIPASILAVLEASHPEYKLYYEMPFSNWDRYDKDVPMAQPVGDEPKREKRSQTRRAVIGSHNLHSLKTHIGYGGSPDAESLRLVHEVVTTCPNLRSLDLSVDHDGCVIASPQPYAFDFAERSQLARAALPLLEYLKLSGYELDGPYEGERKWSSYPWPNKDRLRWPWSRLPQWILANMPMQLIGYMEKPYVPDPCQAKRCCCIDLDKTTNLDGWLERMDFNNLHTLNLGAVSETTLHKLATRANLSSLRNLTITRAGSCAATKLEQFLANSTASLSSLKLRNVEFDDFEQLITVLIDRQTNLTSLSLHEIDGLREHYCRNKHPDNANKTACKEWNGSWYGDRPVLNTTQLRKLSSNSLNLTELDMDVDRDILANDRHGDYFAVIDVLATNAKLRHLTPHFESPDFEAVRNGSRKGMHFDHRKMPYDPLANSTRLESLFGQLREAHTRANSEQPLKDMTVIVGKWEHKGAHGMVSPSKLAIGKFECAVDELGAPRCAGKMVWPDYWSYGYWGDLDEEVALNDFVV